MNPISDKVSIGCVGELLVQIRLLQYGVQAAPPSEDSGNDLIAVNGQEFRAVSVRTTKTGRYKKPKLQRSYHVLAVVHLRGEDHQLHLDQTDIYLLPQEDVAGAPTRCDQLDKYRFSRKQVQLLLGRLPPNDSFRSAARPRSCVIRRPYVFPFSHAKRTCSAWLPLPASRMRVGGSCGGPGRLESRPSAGCGIANLRRDRWARII